MATGPFNRYASPGRVVDQALYDEGLRQFMLRVYNYMAIGLVLTGFVAFFVASSPALYVPLFTTPLKWVVMLAPIAFVFFLSARVATLSPGTTQVLFWVFSGLMGLSLSTIFLVYTGGSIARVFFITAATFAATSLYGYTTRQDLTRMGSFLFMGLIGIVIAGVVNIFIGSTALQFAISVIGVVVFTGLTAWDTQQIKETYDEAWGQEAVSKLAIMGALRLYLDFINLFISLLQLVGDQRR
ncbi:MAG: Bax inhibitor-1/YccA family protein [Azospirillaceae bacterium]|nr:Bax inhibitor-1/YccA family protein [Azospirillaceae bacterium]